MAWMDLVGDDRDREQLQREAVRDKARGGNQWWKQPPPGWRGVGGNPYVEWDLMPQWQRIQAGERWQGGGAHGQDWQGRRPDWQRQWPQQPQWVPQQWPQQPWQQPWQQ